MTTETIQQVELMPPEKGRRQWTIKEKATMLIEAEESKSDVYAVAKKYDIDIALLQDWRSQLANISENEIVPASEYRTGLAKVAAFELKCVNPLVTKILSELGTDKATGYNAACTLNNLVSSVCKLEDLRFQLIDRLKACGGLIEKQKEYTEQDEMEREVAEIITIQLAKRLAEEKGLEHSIKLNKPK